jgi:outer membrane protein assembly factor BamB
MVHALALVLAPLFVSAERPSAQPAVILSPPSLVAAEPGRGAAGDWPKYCANLEMTGVAAGERAISVDSVANLRLAWKDTLSGAVASSPTVVAGTVYVGDWSGTEWAVDAPTGAVLASAYLGVTSAPQCNPPALGVTSAAAVVSGIVYIAGGDDGFYALDAGTLGTLWKTHLGDNQAQGGYYGWCSPAVVNGLVFQGISSNCDNPFINGRVDAMDTVSGAVVASADLSRTSDPTHYGSGVWTSPAVDLGARKVFVTTASAYHYDDAFAYSIVRLTFGDLAIEDAWKLSPDDFALAMDADWGSSPTLFVDSSARALVGAGQKNGYYYAFLRDGLSGGPVWKTQVAVPGECPQCAEGSISTAAFDGTRLYVGGGYPVDFSSPGAVTALDPATGAVLWRAAMGGPVLAPISWANGVVFAAGGKACVALDAVTGAVLWTTNADGLLYGGVSISRGRIFFGDVAGNLYAYEIPAAPK